MFPLPPTHFHPTPLLTLAPHLTPHLPHTLPLLRRLQHHHSSPHAHTLATFPPSPSPPPTSYSTLWIDRSRGPETECWLFSTYELSPHDHNNASLARAEILALFNTVAQLPLPPNRPPGTDYIVVGSLRESLVNLLGGEDLKYITPQSVLSTNLAALPNNAAKDEDKKGGIGVGILAGLSIPYMKWIIAPPPPPSPPSSSPNDSDLPLPPGYHYSHPLPSLNDYALVLSRTSIPRSEATLAKLGSVGIRYLPPSSSSPEEKGEEKREIGDLISWAFLGPDGSLTSLHVEPQHRGGRWGFDL
ncbi:hypothetical protein JMJ35_001646 [Cladonia borealis]|uniref:Uncharacterized protein n=1 Tax=Cladonia borealis TaxID=184061 RepID=A0AA39R650_9LECA|nr:hypothetical protein JMJ35_001646 [Cladonia borealis]